MGRVVSCLGAFDSTIDRTHTTSINPPKTHRAMAPPIIRRLCALLLLLLISPLLATIQQTQDEEARPPTTLPVLWFAPFLSGGGYCSEAIGFLQALGSVDGGGIPVRAEQHGDAINPDFIRGMPPETRELLDRTLATNPVAGFHPRDAVVVCHSEPGAWHPARYQTSRCPPRAGARYTVGRTMFETDRLPEGWAARLNKMDEVWVPTAFHAGIFAAGGVDPGKLQVVGEPVDVAFYDPHNPLLHNTNASSAAKSHPLAKLLPPEALGTAAAPRPFVFLSVFKWEERKGWDVLLKAYFEAFSRVERERVLLVLVTNAYHSSSDFETPIKELAAHHFPNRPYPNELPPVRVLSGLDGLELLHLYHLCDAFVLPSRGEGWGRPHVEAMAMGKPVISTNWSGPTEFITQANAYPLRIEGLTEIQAGPFKGHKYAEPSRAHLRELLRHVQAHPEEAAAKGKIAREDMVRRFSPAAMGRELEAHLRRIERVLASRENGEGAAKVEL